MRQVYEDYLDALTRLAQCQARRDLDSRLYHYLRQKVDELYPQLSEAESADAFGFALSLDKPGEGAVYMKGADDESPTEDPQPEEPSNGALPK